MTKRSCQFPRQLAAAAVQRENHSITKKWNEGLAGSRGVNENRKKKFVHQGFFSRSLSVLVPRYGGNGTKTGKKKRRPCLHPFLFHISGPFPQIASMEHRLWHCFANKKFRALMVSQCSKSPDKDYNWPFYTYPIIYERPFVSFVNIFRPKS